MSMNAATRFATVLSQLRQTNRMSATQASELGGAFSALSPAQQQSLSEKLVDGSGQLSPALQKLLDPSATFSMSAAYTALSLSMPTKTDVAADFKVLA